MVNKVYGAIHMRIMRPLFLSCGENVKFFPRNSYFSYANIAIGNDVYIGPGAFFSTIKLISIGNKVMFGPNVTIIGGDHNITKIGKFMYDVEDKLDENDQPVLIGNDVWIGTGAIILKGVTVGEGSVVAAGSLITKNVEPYSIVAGIPAKKIKMRFSPEDLRRHTSLLNNA